MAETLSGNPRTAGERLGGTEQQQQQRQQQQPQQQQQRQQQPEGGVAPIDVDAGGAEAPGAPRDSLAGEEAERRQEEARSAMLATRPFSEQLAEVVANLKLKSQAAWAVRYLQRLLDVRPTEVATCPGLVALLSRIVSDGPALPAAGGAMIVMARLCLEPEGRARVRAEAALSPVVRFLSSADPESAASNTEAATLLLMDAAGDRIARRSLVAAGAVEAAVSLLKKVRAHSSALAAHATGALAALVVDGGSTPQQRFVDCGGVEAVCSALADRPRSDAGRSTLRLRLVLAGVARSSKAWEARVHQAAADASLSLAQHVAVPSAPVAAVG